MAIKVSLKALADYNEGQQDSELCQRVSRRLGISQVFKGVVTTRSSKGLAKIGNIVVETLLPVICFPGD